MVTVTKPNGIVAPVQPATNGNQIAEVYEYMKKLKAENEALKLQVAAQQTAPAKPVKRDLTLTRADFKREAKEIHLSASEHLPNCVMKPSVNQNGTWMWSSEETDGEVEIGGQVVKAVIKHVVYISGSKGRE